MSDVTIDALNIIDVYRTYGHYFADLDPLKNPEVKDYFIKIDKFQSIIEKKFSEEDLKKQVSIPQQYFCPSMGKNSWTLKEIKDKVERYYSGKISFDFINIPDENQKNWLIEKIECDSIYDKTPEVKKKILFKLLESEAFINYFDETFKVKNNYGVDGIETFISGLGLGVEYASELGVKSVDIGMNHRGRT